MHGGKATNDKSDSHKLAPLRRGGLLPPASVSPAALRATRDLRRRRRHLRHKRAARLSPVQHTHSHYTVPESGKNIAYTTNRAGGATRFAEPAVPKNSAVARALLPSYAARRRDLELSIVKPAKPHEAQTLSLRQTVPGIGQILRFGLRYGSHDSDRFPSVPACAAYGRRVKCAQAAGGTRWGPSGQKIGHAHLQGACSEAAGLGLRTNEPGPKLLARLEHTPDTGQALRILAPTLGRAVYDRRKRHTAFALERVQRASGSRAGAPGASLDTQGGCRHGADV
jgi:hypothetical protein